MSFLTLGLGSDKPMQVDDVSIIDTSFPGFLPDDGRAWASYESPGMEDVGGEGE